jgi:hypothetical protein
MADTAAVTTSNSAAVLAYADLPQTSAGYAVTTQVAAPMTLTGDRTLHGTGLLILAIGSLDVGGNALHVLGDFEQDMEASSDGLLMDDAADSVTIDGDAFFDMVTFGNTTNRFLDGVLRVRGDFTQNLYSSYDDGFVAQGTLVILDGDQAQTVDFASSSNSASRFNDLELDNAAGVTFVNPTFVMGDLDVTDGTAVVLDDVLHVYGQATWEANGSLTGAGTLDVYGELPATPPGNAVAVRVVGDATQTRSVVVRGPSVTITTTNSLTVGGHRVEVRGDFRQDLRTGSDGLQMNLADDEVVVLGTATFHHTYSSGTTTGNFSAGVLRLQGDFVQSHTSSAHISFRSTGTLVSFEGGGTQTVNFQDSNASRFFDVEVVAGTTVQALSDVRLDGSLDIAGRYEVPSATTTLVAVDLTVQTGAELDVAGIVTYGGTYTNDGTVTGNMPAP